MSTTPLAVVVMPAAAAPPAPPAALALVNAVDQPAALELYSAEEALEALVACLDLVRPEQEADLIKAISATLAQNVEKRDSAGRFLGRLATQIAYADSELRRLKTRKELFEKLLEKTEQYLVGVLHMLGRDPSDAKGKRWRKLEGRTCTLGLKNLPASVEFDDETQIPAAYRRLTVKLPETLWTEVLDALPMDLAGKVEAEAKRSAVEVLKTPIKDAIESGTIVPGAHLERDRTNLVVA